MMNIFRYQSSSLLGFDSINNQKLLLCFVCNSQTLRGVIFFLSLQKKKEILHGEDVMHVRQSERICVSVYVRACVCVNNQSVAAVSVHHTEL